MKEMVFTIVTGWSILSILAAFTVVILRKRSNLGYFGECRLFDFDVGVDHGRKKNGDCSDLHL